MICCFYFLICTFQNVATGKLESMCAAQTAFLSESVAPQMWLALNRFYQAHQELFLPQTLGLGMPVDPTPAYHGKSISN